MKQIRLLFAALALSIASLANAAATIHIPDAFLASYIQGGGNLSTGVIKCALIDITSYDRTTDTTLADVTEITGATGYTAGGQTVTSIVVAADTTNHWTTVTITPSVWSALTASTVTGAACYDSTSGNKLIAIDDFGINTPGLGGTYTVGAIVLKFTHF